MPMTQKQEIFTLMGGRVRFSRGRYNPTADAVWLAAFGAGRPAKTVLDVGVGTGGAALCLAANMPGARITGLDISQDMLAECEKNASINACDIELINTDITKWRTDRTFDTVITNPPYFKGTPARHNAHHNADLALWTRKCLARVKPRGTFVIITDAATTASVLSEMAAKCGDIEIFPLFGAKTTAERVLMQGRIGTRGPTVIHRGLSMNEPAILRDGLTIKDALAKLS